jgi:hypothetical protein
MARDETRGENPRRQCPVPRQKRWPTTPGMPPHRATPAGRGGDDGGAPPGISFHGSADAGAGEAYRIAQARARRQSGDPLDGGQVAVAQDPAGNLKPAKDKSTERIDGIVALIMAIGRAMVAQEEPQPEYSLHFV